MELSMMAAISSSLCAVYVMMATILRRPATASLLTVLRFLEPLPLISAFTTVRYENDITIRARIAPSFSKGCFTTTTSLFFDNLDNGDDSEEEFEIYGVDDSFETDEDRADHFLSQLANTIGKPTLLDTTTATSGSLSISSPIAPPADMKAKILQWAATIDYNPEDVRARLKDWIQKYPVLLMSYETCPYCLQVKAVFKSKDVAIKTIELESFGIQQYPIRAELIHMLQEYDHTSIPAVWVGGEFVGGCNDGGRGGNGGVVNLERRGELDVLLQKAGVQSS